MKLPPNARTAWLIIRPSDKNDQIIHQHSGGGGTSPMTDDGGQLQTDHRTTTALLVRLKPFAEEGPGPSDEVLALDSFMS